MQNVKFKCAFVFFAIDAKKSNHSKLYSIHNGKIYNASKIVNMNPL